VTLADTGVPTRESGLTHREGMVPGTHRDGPGAPLWVPNRTAPPRPTRGDQGQKVVC